jgi:hypothetical protein
VILVLATARTDEVQPELLRRLAGTPGVVELPLARHLLDIDVWQLLNYLREASTVTDPTIRTRLLRAAVAAHTGVFAEGRDYDWIEPHREQLRRNGIRARLALADLLATDPTASAAAMVQAADLDPHNEDPRPTNHASPQHHRRHRRHTATTPNPPANPRHRSPPHDEVRSVSTRATSEVKSQHSLTILK